MERELKDLLKALGHPVVWGEFDNDVGFPRMTLSRVGTETLYSLDGRGDLESARVQVTIAAQTYGEIIPLARQVSEAMTGFSGGSVIRCTEVSRTDRKERSAGDAIRLQMLDFRVRYRPGTEAG